MKFLMTMMMTLAMTSAFAECQLNGECTVDTDCKALSMDYAVVKGKCIKPDATQSASTNCADIGNSGRDAKDSAAAGTGTVKPTGNLTK